MATIIEQRRAKLVYDIANSSIKREQHPFRLVVRTKFGQEHVIVFGGSLEQAQASKVRFTEEFYKLRKAFVPRKKPSGSDAKFLSDEDFG